MGSNKNEGAALTTEEQLAQALETIAKQESTITELATKLEGAESTITELATKLEGAESTITELATKLEGAESTITELMNKLDVLESRVTTGKIIVEHEGRQYEVIGAGIPTLGLASEIGAPMVKAGELANHSHAAQLVAQEIGRGSGFLKLIEE